MIKRFFTLILFSTWLFSCSKHETYAASNNVRVRLENASGITLEKATVGNTNYGDVGAGKFTEYKVIDVPIYAGYCSFEIDKVQSGAGVGICGTPMPPVFESGYYTFKVTPAVNGYSSVSVTKE